METDKGYTERDWKLFRQKLPGWQEAYIRRLNEGYIELLSREGSQAENFWELEKRMKRDKRDVGVSAEMRRSRLVQNIHSLLAEGAITIDDLQDFSDEIKEGANRYLEFRRRYNELDFE